MERKTYIAMLRETCARSPDAEAFVLGPRRLTYDDLLAGGPRRARELVALGVGPDDRFGLLLPNSTELVEYFIGGALLGAAVIPINTRFKAHELRHVLTNGELAALVTTDELDEFVNFKELLYEALPELETSADPFRLRLDGAPHLRAVELLGSTTGPGMVDAAALAERAAGVAVPSSEPTPDDPLVIMYTSGTTAHPKGCVIPNYAFSANAYAVAKRLEIPSGDRWWDPLPLFHMGGIMLMSAVFAAGGTFVSMAHFDPDEAFDLVEAERPTVMYSLFPPVTLTLMHHPRFADRDWGNLRFVCSVAPPDVQRQIQDAFAPGVLVSAYGITELTGTVCYNELDEPEEQRLTTCGKPLEGYELRVVDPETGAELPRNVRGELVARGPQVFAGYFGDPEQTAAVMDAAGFFHTGDLCSIDENGHVLFHGRLKDMLKVGGENVAAVEVESFLSTHPAIKMAQVVGVPDDRLVEVPAAFVELAPGQSVTEDEVIAFCKGKIASFKVPRHVRFVDEWPMSATKVQKFRLRERLLEELSVGSPT
jgi:acyl-CoA synthetase (AMP-forming)/AMP-acid ligase II